MDSLPSAFGNFEKLPHIHKKTVIKSKATASSFYILFILLLLFFSTPVMSDIHVLQIYPEKSPSQITNNKFLSVALGVAIIEEDFKNFDMTNPRLQKLLSAISPAYLRIGGTLANKLRFVPNPNNPRFASLEEDGDECSDYDGRSCKAVKHENFNMSGEQWLKINKFAANCSVKVLFDINVLPRMSDGSWDSSNAETLIEFSNRHNLNVIWELGNEPTLYKNHYGIIITPQQLASDFFKLRGILNRYPLYNDSLLVGPDMSQPKANNVKYYKFLQEFLENGGNTIDAVTWHQYNLNGNTAKHADFINPEVFDELKFQIRTIQDTVEAAGFPRKRIWLGETSNAFGGGAPNLSNRFIASFLWLDKLGVSAQYGLDVVIRQTLFRSHYAVVGDDFVPFPDWWVSVIYKQLVGNKVISCESDTSKFVRLYCHCSKQQSNSNNYQNITAYGINLKDIEARVQIRGIASENVYAYILTSDSSLTSKSIRLNNELLELLPHGDVPHFKPIQVKSQPYLVMPPFSLAFWVIPTPSIQFC